MRNSAKTIIGIVLSTLLTGSTTVALVAAAPSLPDPFRSELRTVWTANGVSTTAQERLLSKLEKKQPLDATRAESVPIWIVKSDAEGAHTAVATYSDGSIAVISNRPTITTEMTATSAMSRSVTNCTDGGTSNRFSNCTVFGWFTGVNLSFIADYYASPNGVSAITGYRSGTVACSFPLSCLTPAFALVRKTQSGPNPATLTLTTTWSGLGSGTTRLALFVLGASAYSN
jgi:hypothetical protein